jgi:CDP-paratose 2-epimerase
MEDQMAERWLITGGCGFVGSNLAASLLEDGHEVVALDNLSRFGSTDNLAWLRERASRPGAGRLTFAHADTRSRSDVDDALERHAAGLTAVAHVAGQVAMTTSIERPRHDFEVNAGGALNVLEAIRRFAPKVAVLFSSTNKVYGDLRQFRHEEGATRWTLPDQPHGVDESVALEFHSPYGCSKGAADQYFLDYHRIFGLKTVVFRHSSMYGGRQFATYDQGWVGWFVEQVLKGAHFTISGDGKQVRDLLHADDLVTCYRQAAAHIEACAGRPFNIGGGMASSLSLLELFAMLERLTGKKADFERLPWRVSDQKVFVADTRAARAAFEWEPRVASEDGLRRMVEWVRGLQAR